MKKFLILVASLALVATPVLAQEGTKELTPRQLLLLQVPKDFSIKLGGMIWEVTHESGEPLETITIINPPEIVIYLTNGSKPRRVAGFILLSQENIAPVTVGKFDDAGNFKMLKSPYKSVPETEKEIGEAIIKTVKEILETFNILTDEQLAEFIKKNFAGKKATSL